MAQKGFPPGVGEQLGFYVYALVDPRDNRIFYVGKGKENRAFDHATEAIEGDNSTLKLDRIREVHADGREVDIYIVRHKIESEKAAFDIEAALIDTLVLNNQLEKDALVPELTNIAGGHHSKQIGLMGIDALVGEYHAPKAPEITEPAMLIRISRMWTPTLAQLDGGKALYDATRQWWVLNPERAANAKFAFAVSRGLVRAVYKIDKPGWTGGRWDKANGVWKTKGIRKPQRYSFTGSPAKELEHYKGTDISAQWTKGAQNPIRYLNC